MRIKEIDMRNFFSHRNNKIKFSGEPEIIKISGDNGSGKSIIMSSVIFSLLKTLNKQANIKDIVSWGEKSSTLKTTFEDNKNQAVIKRKIKKSVSTEFKYTQKGELQKGKGSVEKEKNNEIQNYFGVNDTFMHNQQFSSEMIDRFIWKTPTERMKFIEKALNLDEQNKYYDLINKKYFALSNEIKIEKVKLNSLKEERQRTSNTIIKQYEEQIKSYKDSLEDIKDENIVYIPQQKKQIENYKNMYSDYEKSNNKYQGTSYKINEELKKVNDTKNRLSSDIRYLKQKITENENLLEQGICPTCKREFDDDDVHEYTNNSKEFKERISKLQKQFQDVDKDHKKMQEELKSNQDIVNSNYKEMQNLKIKIQNIENNIKQSKEKESFYETKINELYKKLNASNKELDKDFDTKINSLKQKIKVLEDKQNILNTWKSVFGPKSPIRTSIIENYTTLLSERTQYYVSRLFDADVTFGFVFDSDKGILDYKITFENNDTSIANLSLGQIRMIELAVLFAFYEIMVVKNDNKLKILLLDEAVYGLSQHYIQKFMDLLEEFKTTYGLQILFVSHEDIDESYFDRVINVELFGTESKIL